MKHIFSALLLLALSVLPAAAQTAEWIESVGGTYSNNAAGEILAVDLSSSWLTDADLGRLADLEALEHIDLSYTKITDLALERLAPLENVKSLDLYYAEYVTDAGVAHLTPWRNIERLNLRGTKVSSFVF